MAPKKDWGPEKRKRKEYKKYDFTVDGRDYILEVPDAVTTSVILQSRKKTRTLQ